MKTYNPHTEPHIALSECCNAKCLFCPPCFGDPEIVVCDKCHKQTKAIYKPMYEKISKGHYRPIKHQTP